MLYVRGDIWDFHDAGNPIVITTNIGWNKDGHNIMGAGIALQAKVRYKWIPKILGNYYIRNESESSTLLFYEGIQQKRFIFFPTKPLAEPPHLSWKQESQLWLIERSLQDMVTLVSKDPDFREDQIFLPLVGCGNGGLDREEVLPLLERYLDDQYALVEK